MGKPTTLQVPVHENKGEQTLELDSVPKQLSMLRQVEQQLAEQELGLRAFRSMRDKYKERYHAIVSQKEILSHNVGKLEQIWERIHIEPQNPEWFAKKHYQASLNELHERSQELLKELQKVLQTRTRVVASWRNLIHEVSYRLHLLQKVEEQLEPLEQELSEIREMKRRVEEERAARSETSVIRDKRWHDEQSKETYDTIEIEDKDEDEDEDEELLALFNAHTADKPSVNQRKHPRLVLGTVVSFSETEHSFFTGFSENISEGGLFIATYAMQPSLGEQFQLSFTLPNHTVIEVVGEVTWIREHSPNSPHISPGFGCKFTNLSPEDQVAINSTIEMAGALFMP